MELSSGVSRIESLLIKKGFTFQNELQDGSLVYWRSDKVGGWYAEIDPVALTVNGISIEEFLDIFNKRKK